MKSYKFIQFYDANENPILSDAGIVDYDKRTRKHEAIIKQLQTAGKVPENAVFWSLKKTILKSSVKISQIYIINI